MTNQAKDLLRVKEGLDDTASSKRVKLTLNEADDVNVDNIDPLIPPQILMEDQPATSAALHTVQKCRADIAHVLNDEDDRLVVVVGPCSVHDVTAAKEYGMWIKGEMKKHEKDLLIVMRVYFEKPRTTVGWKGLINDPNLDGTYRINKGLRIARQLLLDLNSEGIPAAVEFLDTITPQFFGDLVSWGAIGARTTESQVHRELASGLSCPVGFKNGTSGDTEIAAQAVLASGHPHHFLSVTKQGLAAIVSTSGNPHCHIILRGGKDGPNYSAAHVDAAVTELTKTGVTTKVMIDCSHGNSNKQHKNQIKVADDVAAQLATGNRHLFGVMVESNLAEGAQKLGDKGPEGLKYGQSITDACVGLEDTAAMLEALAKGVRDRRLKLSK